MNRLSETVRAAKAMLRQVTPDELLRHRPVQGLEVSGWRVLFDSLPHFKGHTQEIVCLTRWQLRDKYDFYWEPS